MAAFLMVSALIADSNLVLQEAVEIHSILPPLPPPSPPAPVRTGRDDALVAVFSLYQYKPRTL